MLNIVRFVSFFLLLSAAVILSVALAVPWPQRVFSWNGGAVGDVAGPGDITGAPAPLETRTPLEISQSFGYIPPVETPRAPEPVSQPEAEPEPGLATWVQPVGYVISSDGERRYVLKITSPRESIISLAVGESSAGIALLAAEGNRLLIQRGEERYFVPVSVR